MSTAPIKSKGVRVGCDIGGTFTDVVLAMPDGRLFVNKTSTTPEDLGKAIVHGLGALITQAGIEPSDITEIVHGTTTASNTILQKVGAKTGLLTTYGFRDVLEIGRIRTPTMFDLSWSKPEPLVTRRWRRGIRERMGANGEVVTALDTEQLIQQATALVEEGVTAIAISFLNSYINPAHELQAKEILQKQFPKVLVSTSFEVLPEIKEYERTSTTVVNAYILPAMRTYLARLRQDLQEMGIRASLQVMASNGGMMGIASASEKPVFAVASGPAGGVTGAARLGSVTGGGNQIVFDMGGTTAKAAIVVDGEPSLTNEYEFRDGISAPSRFVKGGGYVLKVPAIDIAEVGAGGGSIAWIDSGGLLCVGPESAGAFPGPACYNKGNGRPTVTDANMVLGYLNPEALAGGSLAVFPDLSAKAIAEHVGEPLGLDLVKAAHGIRHIANVNMARAIRAVTVERGLDPRDMSMMAFGGGGPLHAVAVARLLGIRRVVAPIMAGVFCSAGMLAADAEHNFVKAILRPLDECLHDELSRAAVILGDQGYTVLASEGYTGDAALVVYAADVRYLGQSSELTVQLKSEKFDAEVIAQLKQDFNAQYQQTFGYSSDEPLELVNLRISARGRSEHRLEFADCQVDATALQGSQGERQVSFDSNEPRCSTPVVPRASVGKSAVQGPVIIESYDTTIVVPPGCTAFADDIGNIIIDIQGDQRMSKNIDPITFAVVKNAMDSIVDEVAYTVLRTARSEIVKDVMDYSAAICDRHGQMIAQAKTIALHLGAIPEAMAEVKRRYGDSLQPGDAVIVNDPYQGGMHLPDIFMFAPFFYKGEIEGYSVVICHHTDVGGRVPGSNASDSTEIYQEGLRIPVVKLYEAGKVNDTMERIIAQNVRVPDRVLGDLRAQYAACQVGSRELTRLLDRYGREDTRMYFAELLDYAERLTREEIRNWPKGTFFFEDFIDDDGLSEDPIPLRVAVTVHEDRISVDYTGTSPQVRAAINSTLSYTKSCTYLSVRCALKGDVPNNEGLFRCVEVHVPEGTVLNPVEPAAVAARALTGYRVFDTMLGALAEVVPDRIPAAGEGGNTVVCLSGKKDDGKGYIIVDMVCGAWGGRPHADGVEAITNASQNLSNTPIETLEAQHPVRVESYELVPDSCGAGRYRGGLGVRRSYRTLGDDVFLQLRADRMKFQPYGLQGGLPASAASNLLEHEGEARSLPSKVGMRIARNDLVSHTQPGGGGFGNPLDRPFESIEHDVWDHKLTAKFVREHYHAVVDPHSGKIDIKATETLRSLIN